MSSQTGTTVPSPRIPLRDRIARVDVRSGDILDGRRAGVPEYWRVRHVRALDGVRLGLAHVRLDTSAPHARAVLRRANRVVTALARHVGRAGAYLSVCHEREGDSRSLCLRISVVCGRSVTQCLVLEVGSTLATYREEHEGSWRLWSRADVTMRRLGAGHDLDGTPSA